MLDLSKPEDREKLEELIQDDINSFCVNFYEHGHRNHLGASELGEECWRKLWYGFRWVKEDKFLPETGRMLRLFNVGHAAEPRFVTYLRGIGFDIKEFANPILNYNDTQNHYFWSDALDAFSKDVSDNPIHVAEALKRDIKPNQFRISGANGHYGGSLDGIGKAPERYQLSEDIVLSLSFKTNNTGSGYAKVAEESLQKSKPKHFAQECQYGYKRGINYCLYMIENKNDSDITIKIVKLDLNYGAQLEKKAETIIYSKEPPPRIAENPASWHCTYCHVKGICHDGEIPEKNCRSCRNAVPTDNAEWRCNLHQANIPIEWIKKGCDQWLPI